MRSGPSGRGGGGGRSGIAPDHAACGGYGVADSLHAGAAVVEALGAESATFGGSGRAGSPHAPSASTLAGNIAHHRRIAADGTIALMVRRFVVSLALALGVGLAASVVSAPASADCPRPAEVVTLVTRGDQSLATNAVVGVRDHRPHRRAKLWS